MPLSTVPVRGEDQQLEPSKKIAPIALDVESAEKTAASTVEVDVDDDKGEESVRAKAAAGAVALLGESVPLSPDSSPSSSRSSSASRAASQKAASPASPASEQKPKKTKKKAKRKTKKAKRRTSRSVSSAKSKSGSSSSSRSSASRSRMRSRSRSRIPRRGGSRAIAVYTGGSRAIRRSPSRGGRREMSQRGLGRSPRRSPQGGRLPPAAPARLINVECWFGKACKRTSCWFRHPEGRFIDGISKIFEDRESPFIRGRAPPRAGPAGGRSPAGRRRPRPGSRSPAARSRSRHNGRSRNRPAERRRAGSSRSSSTRSPPPPRRRRRRASPSYKPERKQQGAGKKGRAASSTRSSSGAPADRSGSAGRRGGRGRGRGGRGGRNLRRKQRSASSSGRSSSGGRGRSHSSDSSRDGRRPRSGASSRQSSQSDEAKAPAVSFYDFVVGRLSDDATPEEALAAYAAFCARLEMEQKETQQRESFESLMARVADTRVLFDAYHPLAERRRQELRRSLVQARAKTFIEDLRLGRYGQLSFRAPTADTHRRSGAVLQGLAEHAAAPYFALDPDAATVCFESIPADVSIWKILDHFKESAGLLGATTTKLLRRELRDKLLRQLRLRFADLSGARAALQGFRAKAASAPTAADAEGAGSLAQLQLDIANPRGALDALVLPPEMSLPERIGRDAELSQRLLQRLNELTGVAAEVTDALLKHEGSPESKLDLQMLYLRRVHCCCYYGSAWCDDEWDLLRRCGPLVLRFAAEAASDETPGAWSEAHELRVTKLIDGASLPAAELPSAGDEAVELLCESSTREITASKYQCKMCDKLFKGPNYVQKHINKMHQAKLEAARETALEPFAAKRCQEHGGVAL